MPEGDGQGEQQESPECPICGQPYDHKRKERSNSVSSAPRLREDATQCKTDDFGLDERTVYVHV